MPAPRRSARTAIHVISQSEPGRGSYVRKPTTRSPSVATNPAWVRTASAHPAMPAASPNQAGSPCTIASHASASNAGSSALIMGHRIAGVAATMRRAMSEHTERLQKLRERVLAAKEFL